VARLLVAPIAACDGQAQTRLELSFAALHLSARLRRCRGSFIGTQRHHVERMPPA
jgi:hypothetical protein